jgi:glycosyltransferase involved in cell wall biosynthesis
MKVSLIATVKDGAEHIGEFLSSVRAQTRPPDEIVIVDGGSTDGTRELLLEADDVTFLEERGANIARGRNLAIEAATHDVLAVSDADCVVEPDWLERLVAGVEGGADVAMGFYAPIADGFFQECMAAVNLPDASEVDEAGFMPSARSVAFRRSAIEAAGGYPERLDIGEDMFVNHRWRERGLELRFVPEAVAHWRLRPGFVPTWRQYFRYARGDAIAGLHPGRHALRFAVYAGLVAALASRRRWAMAFCVVAGTAYAAKPVSRAMARFPHPRDRAAAAATVPALMAAIDVAKMAGFVAGLLARRRSGGARPR